jgi:hypothetical protein
LGKGALLLRGNGRDAAWQNFATLGDETAEQFHVLVIDCRCVRAREGARFTTTEEYFAATGSITFSTGTACAIALRAVTAAEAAAFTAATGWAVATGATGLE